MSWVGSFSFPRSSGSDGEVRAVNMLAGQFEQNGWRVALAETRIGCRWCTLLMLLGMAVLFLGYDGWNAVRLTLPGSSTLVRLAAFVTTWVVFAGAALALLGRDAAQVAWQRISAAWKASGTLRMVNLVATWPSELDPPARVLVVTPVDIPVTLAGRYDRIWALVLPLLMCAAYSKRLPPIWAAWLQAAALLLVICTLARYWLRQGRPAPGDNRSGLAILAELAQALPAKLHERVEIRLAAVGNGTNGQLGALTLADYLRLHWPAKPTLVINVEAAGAGTDLRLAGSGDALRVAGTAAKDLWIPHRISRWSSWLLGHVPFTMNRIEAVSIVGDRWATSVEPATLAATAQLVAEIALRWARMGGADQPVTLARSSQKPG